MLAAVAGGQGLPQAIQQKPAVGKTCQGIKKREISDLVIRYLQLPQLPLPPSSRQHPQATTPPATNTGAMMQRLTNHHDRYHGVRTWKANWALSLHTPSLPW